MICLLLNIQIEICQLTVIVITSVTFQQLRVIVVKTKGDILIPTLQRQKKLPRSQKQMLYHMFIDFFTFFQASPTNKSK